MMVLAVAVAASFMAFLDGSVVTVALASIEHELGGGVAGQQWVVDGYLLTLGSLILLAGAIADRCGRARALRIGVVVFCAASLACALAPSEGWLIAARFVQGAGAALLVPSSLALITAHYDGPARARAIGSWTGWTSVAFIIGPLLGGALVDAVGWRWVFAVNLLPGLVTLVLMRGFRESQATRTGRIDVLGAVMVALGLGGVVFGLIEQPRLGWGSPLLWVCLGGGAALLVAFVWRESRVPEPLLPLSLFRARNFAAGNAATAAIYAGVGIAVWIVVLFLLEVQHLPAALVGLATLPVAVMSLLFSRLFGALAGKHGPRLFMTLGPIVSACGFAWMLMPSTPFDFWLQILPGLVLYGLGLAITVSPLTAAVLSAVPPRRSGIGSAVNNAVARIAGLVAVAFCGPIIGVTLDLAGFQRVVAVTAGLLLVGAVISAVGITNRLEHPLTVASGAACVDKPVPGAAAVVTDHGSVPAHEPGAHRVQSSD